MSNVGMTREQASQFAALALNGLSREYPHHLDHVLQGEQDLGTPAELHPIFYGCYDWHSAVHGYWLLARCLRRYSDLEAAPQIIEHFESHLTEERAAVEAHSLAGSPVFERPYGWGWLLAFVTEVALWEDPQSRRWRRVLTPITESVADAFFQYLDRLDYPVRSGVHSNTAFALVLAAHFAQVIEHDLLGDDITLSARRFFLEDRDYPFRYEPNGEDFLSAGLTEAVLVSQALPAAEFREWFAGFDPEQGSLLEPAKVSDRRDPRIVHLDGLNLSRAWCLRAIARCLGSEDPRYSALDACAEAHLAASLPHIASREYVGEHWLATFGALALEGLEAEPALRAG
jgi:Protein of unknown function (DUF2891)